MPVPELWPNLNRKTDIQDGGIQPHAGNAWEVQYLQRIGILKGDAEPEICFLTPEIVFRRELRWKI